MLRYLSAYTAKHPILRGDNGNYETLRAQGEDKQSFIIKSVSGTAIFNKKLIKG